jgi:hypothetical protein
MIKIKTQPFFYLVTQIYIVNKFFYMLKYLSLVKLRENIKYAV